MEAESPTNPDLGAVSVFSVPARFDLITVDVVDPRATAADVMSRANFVVELDEDDGRWLVLSSPTKPQRFGLQRSDRREVSARSGEIDDVLDGQLTLPVADPARAAGFFRSALGLTGRDELLELDGQPVLQLVDGQPTPSNLHLDLVCELPEFDRESERLLDLGATRLGPHRSEHWGESQIFVAPSGAVFCLNAYSA